jgi:hypothetical protein
MNDAAPKRDDSRPYAIADGESILWKWPNVHDLDNCTFTYKGKSVPGKALARLLGLEDAASADAAKEK